MSVLQRILPSSKPISKCLSLMVPSFSRRTFSTDRKSLQQMAEKRKNLPRNLNVCVVGAAGGIGQPLSLLLRGSPLVKKLSLYDVAPVTPGVAVDLSHISDDVECVGYGGNDGLDAALKDANYVLIPAGVARKPGMTRDDLFNINASIVASTAKSIAKNCPSAHICLITNPINSTVPLVAEVLKRIGCYNPKKLYGITTLDLLRASTFVHGAKDQTLAVPVIGGHAGITILPLLSQLKGVEFTDQEIKDLTQRIMFGGDEVVKAKAGGGSATLSMAFAANTFFNQLAYGILGGRAPVMPGAYIESSVCQSKDSNITFFSTQFTVNQNGIDKISEIPFSKMSKFENEKLDAMLPELKDAIIKGVNFGRDFKL